MGDRRTEIDQETAGLALVQVALMRAALIGVQANAVQLLADGGLPTRLKPLVEAIVLQSDVDPIPRKASKVRQPYPERSASSSAKGVPMSQVRRWAREHGLEVQSQGRLPDHVIMMWRAAQDAPAE